MNTQACWQQMQSNPGNQKSRHLLVEMAVIDGQPNEEFTECVGFSHDKFSKKTKTIFPSVKLLFFSNVVGPKISAVLGLKV